MIPQSNQNPQSNDDPKTILEPYVLNIQWHPTKSGSPTSGQETIFLPKYRRVNRPHPNYRPVLDQAIKDFRTKNGIPEELKLSLVQVLPIK